MHQIAVFQRTVYANVMCHFQQNMFYSGIRGISDLLHSSKAPLKWSLHDEFICVEENLEKYICKTNIKGAITTQYTLKNSGLFLSHG